MRMFGLAADHSAGRESLAVGISDMVVVVKWLLLLVCWPVFAGGFHAEAGLGVHDRLHTDIIVTDQYDNTYKAKVRASSTDGVSNPLGVFDLYYQAGRYKAGWLHTSALFKRELHGGYNVLYVKYRLF